MQTNLIAPCPKKPSSSYSRNNWLYDSSYLQDACLELQQILVGTTVGLNENLIARSRNPLTQDESFFIPLHQAVSQLQISDMIQRPKSYCVGERI